MIYLASDHAGFELKKQIAEFLNEEKIDFVDMGPHQYDQLDDYPDFIIPAAEKVAENLDDNLGIIVGASGQGEAIAANKIKGIRAALYYGGQNEIVELSKVHNDANILSLGAKFLDKEKAIEAVSLWLKTEFLNEQRHARRIEKIKKYENK